LFILCRPYLNVWAALEYTNTNMIEPLKGNTMINNSVNDVKAIEDKFVVAMGSGVAATRHLADLIVSITVSYDTRNVSSIINRLDNKHDASGSRAVRQIFKAIFTGASYVKSKDKKSIVLKMKDKTVDIEALTRLHEGAASGLSIRATLVSHVKGDIAKPEYDQGKVIKALVASQLKKEEDDVCDIHDNIKVLEAALAVAHARRAALTKEDICNH